VLTREELVARFSLEGISGGNAVFNTEKLDWFNHQPLLRLPDDELLLRLRPSLEAAGYWRNAFAASATDRQWLVRVLALLRPRCKRIPEFVDQVAPFFDEPARYDADGVKKHLSAPEMPAHLEALRDASASADPFDEATLEQALRTLAGEHGIKPGALVHGARLAATGGMVSPGLFEMLVLIGRDRVVARLGKLIASIPEVLRS